MRYVLVIWRVCLLDMFLVDQRQMSLHGCGFFFKYHNVVQSIDCSVVAKHLMVSIK